MARRMLIICRFASVHRTVGLEYHGRRRRPWRDAQHAFRTRQCEAWHIAGDGGQTVHGFRRHRRRLASDLSHIRADRMKLKKLELV